MTNTPRHIVLLTPGFPENEKDTTTIPALQIYIKVLSEMQPRFNIQIITFQYPFTSNNYRWNGLYVFPLNGNNSKLKKIFVWQKAKQLLRKLHQKIPIDYIHSFWIGECSFIGEKFARKHNIKHLITAMGQDVLKPNKYVKSHYKSDSKIITLSKRHSKFLKQNFDINSQIIPWGISLKEFPEIQKTTIDVLGVGSLNTVKNYIVFMEVISNLIKSYPKLKVEIIGEGKENNTLQKIIQSEGIEKNITLHGKLTREHVLLKMARSNILLHSSTFESFGLVFSEALFSGMHIVSYNVGVAITISKWKICKNQLDMIAQCSTLLKENQIEKQRVLLHPVVETLNSYLKLYNMK